MDLDQVLQIVHMELFGPDKTYAHWARQEAIESLIALVKEYKQFRSLIEAVKKAWTVERMVPGHSSYEAWMKTIVFTPKHQTRILMEALKIKEEMREAIKAEAKASEG